LRAFADVNKREYPTSGRKKVDWDQLAREVPEDKLEGEAALQKVFAGTALQLYYLI
jgi:hypothetical protein